MVIWIVWWYAFIPGNDISCYFYLWVVSVTVAAPDVGTAAFAVYLNSFPVINFLIFSFLIFLLCHWFGGSQSTIYVRACVCVCVRDIVHCPRLVVALDALRAGTSWCRMEICQIKIMDKLFWRRRHMPATIQHYTSTKIALVHRAMDEEKVLRTVEND